VKFSLRTRFTAAFALAALIPIAAAAVAARELIQRRYRADYQRALALARADAEREVKRLYTEVYASAAGFATANLPVQIALDFEKYGQVDEGKQRDYRDTAPSIMRSLGLDVLTVIGPDGRVIVSGHWPGRAGATERGAAANLGLGRAYLTRERVLGPDGATPQRLAVAATMRVSSESLQPDAAPTLVVVGRTLDAHFVERLYRPGLVEVRLVEDGGFELVPGGRPWSDSARFPHAEVPLLDVAGKPRARVIVAVPDTELHRTLRALTFGAIGLAGAGLLLSILLGMLVARRITRGLGTLTHGAQAVASGDLTHRVPVVGADEIAELAVAFNKMTSDLGEASDRLVHAERIAAWQEIARRIAHEIKNPLTPIQMSMETLQRTYRAKHPKLDEIVEESTRTVLEECTRLKRIVTEFSQFARMPKPELAPCDLGEVVSAALALYKGGTVPLTQELGPVPTVRADRDQLTQVVLNLLENARDAVAGRDDGKISIRTREAGGGALLEITDNGVGFDPAVQGKLFAPYFTTKHSGTGLGLAIVQRIVTDHGGKISAEGEPGKGATFKVTLPGVAA